MSREINESATQFAEEIKPSEDIDVAEVLIRAQKKWENPDLNTVDLIFKFHREEISRGAQEYRYYILVRLNTLRVKLVAVSKEQ